MPVAEAAQPVGNFHPVDAGIFRGAQPEGDQFKELKRLGIKTIIKLNTENLEEERAAARDLGITLVEIPLSGFFAPSNRDMDRAQAALDSADARPIFFHCEYGKDRTGLVAAIHRVFKDHWTPARASEEWYALGHSRLLISMDHFFHEKTGSE